MSDPTNSSPRQWGGGAKRRRGMSDPTNSSPRQWGGGAKRRRGMSDPTPPHVGGEVARSAGGACQTQLLPTSVGRWREAPEGHVRPNSSPRQWGGGAKRRRGMSDLRVSVASSHEYPTKHSPGDAWARTVQLVDVLVGRADRRLEPAQQLARGRRPLARVAVHRELEDRRKGNRQVGRDLAHV